MKNRRKTSGGQAIVLVTLALFSMAGMMGLAVDLGWSYFVQKEAQASADGAALAAVHEAWQRLGGVIGSGVACNNSGATTLWCSKSSSPPGDACGAGNATGASNLYAGCLYAINNGFNYVNQPMKVTMQADVGSDTLPLTPTGASLNILKGNIAYWVTVRTATNIPQLFSAIAGHAQGTVAAIATAAIAAQVTPGSFIGLDREGDCLTDSTGTKFDCGVDIDVSSAGNATCYNNDGTSAGVTAKVCAPAGVYLSSQCNGSSITGCGTQNGTSGYAGETTNNPTIWASTSGTQVRLAGTVNKPSNFTPTAPTDGTDGSQFQDPTQKKLQPPLATPASSLPTCGILDSSGNGGSLSGNVGPFQYYSYQMVGGVAVPTGNPINIGNNTTVNFAEGYGCPGLGPTTSSGTFGTYVFYGGLLMNGNKNTNVTFDAGQYVMAGTSSQSGAVMSMDGNGTFTGNTSAGTMFVFTDGTYADSSGNPVLTPPTGMPTLYQGYVDIKNANITLAGLGSSSPMDQTYKDILFWQDRENSTDTLNLKTGAVVTQGTPCSACKVTNTSPALIFEDGDGTLNLTGVSYQPTGAWIELKAGTASVATSHLQIVTGALETPNGSGSSSITLLGPSNPIVTFVTSLIQ